MKTPCDSHGMNRRTFLKAAMVGAAPASFSLTGAERLLYAQIPPAALREQGKVPFFGVSTRTNQAEVIDGIVNDPGRLFGTGQNRSGAPFARLLPFWRHGS